MQEFIINIMENFGYIGIFLLITIENIFPPIPSEIILLFGGFMTTKTNLTLAGTIIFSTLGSLIGAIILYYIGSIFNKEKLIKMANGKVGRILHFNKNDIIKADEWFINKGIKTIFYCRFVPILRSLISIPAGMAKISILTFVVYTLSGSLIWNVILILLGRYLGNKWTSILNFFNAYQNICLIILVILILIGIIILIKKKRKEQL